MAVIRFRVSEEIKAKFFQENENPSQVLRDFVISSTGTDASDGIKIPLAKSVQFRINEEERKKLESYCNKVELKPTDVMRRQFYILLDQEPYFCGEEVEALKDANRQLRGVGRNLNQLIRAINTDQAKVEDLKQILLDAIIAAIKVQTSKIDSLVARSLQRIE